MIAWTSVCVLLLAGTLLLDAVHTADVLEDFLELFSGIFTDARQVGSDAQTRDVMEFQIQRVDVPAIQPARALYFRELVDGRPLRRTVLAVSPADGQKLLVVQYNISEAAYPSSQELSAADFSALTLGDLQTNPGCKAIFELLVPNVYSGNWADCRHLVQGERPLYLFTITCKGINLEPPVGASEQSTLVPYNLDRVGDSPPPADRPGDYVPPCSRKQ